MVGAVVSAVAGVLLVMTVTRGLDKNDAGTVFTTTAIFLVVVAIVQMGADVGLVRWMPHYVATGAERNISAAMRAAFVPVLGLSLLVAAAALVGNSWLSGQFGSANAKVVGEQLTILAVFVPIAAAYNLVLAATRSLRTMRPTVFVDSLGRDPVQLLLVFTASALGLSSVAFVAAWAVPYALALSVSGVWLVLLVRRARRSARVPHSPEAPPDEGILRQFWQYTAPRGVATIAQTLLKRSDLILVAALSTQANVALYAAATRFVVFGQLGVQALQQALAPHMSATLAEAKHEEAQDIYRTTTAWAMVVAWPVYLSSAVLAPWVLRLFGPGYQDAAPVVTILCLAMLAATACGSVDTVLLMAGRSWLSLMNTGIALVLNVGLNLLLIPSIGILGAAISWAAAILVRNALPLAMINRMLGMSPFGAGAAWVAVSSVLCIGLPSAALRLAGASATWILISLVVGSVGYALALYWGRRPLHLAAFGAIRN